MNRNIFLSNHIVIGYTDILELKVRSRCRLCILLLCILGRISCQINYRRNFEHCPKTQSKISPPEHNLTPDSISHPIYHKQWEVNDFKSCKKFNETAEMANGTDFPLIVCGNGPKWTKTIQTRFSLQKN